MEEALKPTGDRPGPHAISKSESSLVLLSPTSKKEFRTPAPLHNVSIHHGYRNRGLGLWDLDSGFKA